LVLDDLRHADKPALPKIEGPGLPHGVCAVRRKKDEAQPTLIAGIKRGVAKLGPAIVAFERL
jgi:hypothetical protein